MRLVVDTNILFAGLLRDGTTRRVLIDPPLSLLAPEHALAEIRKHAETIATRSELSIDGVEILLALLTENVAIHPRDQFDHEVPRARKQIGHQDPGDIPFLALALAQPCEGIWTHNEQDFEGASVDIWTTRRVLEQIESEG